MKKTFILFCAAQIALITLALAQLEQPESSWRAAFVVNATARGPYAIGIKSVSGAILWTHEPPPGATCDTYWGINTIRIENQGLSDCMYAEDRIYYQMIYRDASGGWHNASDGFSVWDAVHNSIECGYGRGYECCCGFLGCPTNPATYRLGMLVTPCYWPNQ